MAVVALSLAAALACSTGAHARADGPETRAELRGPSVANWIVGVALAGVSGLTLGSVVYTAVRSGACVGQTEPSGRCTERVDFGWRSGVFLSVGIASLLAATFFVVLHPIRVSLGIGAQRALLELETRF